jgi:hypothetical protein
LPQQAFWKNAGLSKPIEHLAVQAKTWLPDNVAQNIHYQN